MFQQHFEQAKTAISYLTTDELKELLDNDEKLEERVNEVLKVLEREKQVIISESRNIAEDNVNKEPEIIERKSRIGELSEQGKTLCLQIQEQLDEMKGKKGDKTPDTVLALLRAAAAESEESSESIAAKFQHSEIPIDEYLETFMPIRKLMHARKMKTEKMMEIIQKEAQNTPVGLPWTYPGQPQPAPNFYPSRPIGVPYPSGMPMPTQPYPRF